MDAMRGSGVTAEHVRRLLVAMEDVLGRVVEGDGTAYARVPRTSLIELHAATVAMVDGMEHGADQVMATATAKKIKHALLGFGVF